MIIDHIGIVVLEMENGITQWTECFGYSKLTEVVTNKIQKVDVVFLSKKNSVTVKLISPAHISSSVYGFAKRGGGLHHICFKVGDMEQEIPILKQKGMRLISPPTPGEAFGNENIAFLLAKNNLNIELIDTDKKEELIDENGI